jgi:hypothetical protein
VDLDPIDLRDEDSVLWLRALIWPEHEERHARLRAAAAIAREQTPKIVRGDAVELLPGLLEQAPEAASLVVYATHSLYQLPRQGVARIVESLAEHARQRPVWLLALEGTGPNCSEFARVLFDGDSRRTHKLANASPHGWWIEWLGEQASAPTRENSRWVHWLAGLRAAPAADVPARPPTRDPRRAYE